MSSPVYRLYIAEYERTPAWMSGGASAFLKYVKPYDHYCVYITGRSKLPPDHYRTTLEKLGEQCEIIDATEMPDPDLRAHMAGRIEQYATDDTYVFFLGCDTDYAALKGKVSHWKSFSQLATFRTGRLDLLAQLEGTKQDKSSRKLFPGMLAEIQKEEKEPVLNKAEEPSNVKNNAPVESSTQQREKQNRKSPDNKHAAPKRQSDRKNGRDREARKGKRLKPRQNENNRNTKRASTDPEMMDLFFQGFGSVHVGDPQVHGDTPPKETARDVHLAAGKGTSQSGQKLSEQTANSKEETSASINSTGRENQECNEKKDSWKERISGGKEEGTERSQGGSMIQALEKAIFGVQQNFETPQKHYSELDDSKAKTVSLMADRLITTINLLVSGILDFHFSYEDYMELIATLVKSDNLDDFQEGWSIVHPGCRLKLNEEIYRAIKNEANYYAKTCDVLYGEDCW